MSTQFVSKNSNYMIVLKNGIEGNRILGTQPVSGIYIKFEGGIVTVKEESIAEMLRTHPGFGVDFIEVKEEDVVKDPYADSRDEIEPIHVISNIKYGHVEKVPGAPAKVKMTPQMKDFVKSEAVKMLPGLLKENPEILKGIILDLAKEMKAKEIPPEEPLEEKVEAPTPKTTTKKVVKE